VGVPIVAYEPAILVRVTVAAVILSATTDGAIRDVQGRPLVRRLAEAAWSGGAVPVVVVTPDPDGVVANALAGSAAILAEPAPPSRGPIGQIVRGITVARGSVAGTDAALIWPARLAWVDPETITSLIQAHGLGADELLRPTWHGAAGWPVVLPTRRMADLAWVPAGTMPGQALEILVQRGVPQRLIELGDPGVTHDLDTPEDRLPPYEGPAGPLEQAPEWGSAAAERDDGAALEGPALAPFEQAADPDA
jgi:CTP:molybdopterin cytidylyltransferase MocA